jgi:hypothetical protein
MPPFLILNHNQDVIYFYSLKKGSKIKENFDILFKINV